METKGIEMGMKRGQEKKRGVQREVERKKGGSGRGR